MRRADWLERLWMVLKAAEANQFGFAKHDCVRLVAAALDAMTGSEWGYELDEIYSTEREALRIMATPGLLEQLVSERYGAPVPLGLARRGDIVALNLELGPALGICIGERVAVAGDGVKYLPLARAHCAWHVE